MGAELNTAHGDPSDPRPYDIVAALHTEAGHDDHRGAGGLCRNAADEIERLRFQVSSYEGMCDLPWLPAEKVARFFLENERLYNRREFDEFAVSRLTQLVTRARFDGANGRK